MPTPTAVTNGLARLARLVFLMVLLAIPALAVAQQPDSTKPAVKADSQPAAPLPETRGAFLPKIKPWYERYTLRGYTQVRYDDLFQDNPDYICPPCDRGLGGPKDFTIRRARLTFLANPVDQVGFKAEIDLNNASGGQNFYLQMRELYGEIFFEKTKNAWVRMGLAKVPFGYDNLQSSSVRIAFDRSDAINSAAPGERDLGVFFFWAPSAIHKRLRAMVDSGYKGEGDNGIFGIGLYNGQGANRPEANDNKTVAARLSYPFLLPKNQIVELGVQGLTGIYTLTADLRGPTVTGTTDWQYEDKRVGVSAVLVPRPFGVSAEWNWGKGPAYDLNQNAVVDSTVNGGFVQAEYRIALPQGRLLYPYVRWQRYQGGKKAEVDARYYDVKELEAGLEFLWVRAVEFTAAFVHGTRAYAASDLPAANRMKPQEANFVRLQVQFNY